MTLRRVPGREEHTTVTRRAVSEVVGLQETLRTCVCALVLDVRMCNVMPLDGSSACKFPLCLCSDFLTHHTCFQSPEITRILVH